MTYLIAFWGFRLIAGIVAVHIILCTSCFVVGQEVEAKAKAEEDEQRKAEERFLELQRKAKEQQEK